jgi:hypothetical protein
MMMMMMIIIIIITATTGCSTLAKNEYAIRHDKVCTHVHYTIFKILTIETTHNSYSHIRKTVNEH